MYEHDYLINHDIVGNVGGIHVLPIDAIVVLLSVCDGAQHIDGIGFSKFDAKFVRNLVAFYDKAQFFTPRQKSALKIILHKYRVQLSTHGIEYDMIAW